MLHRSSGQKLTFDRRQCNPTDDEYPRVDDDDSKRAQPHRQNATGSEDGQRAAYLYENEIEETNAFDVREKSKRRTQ